MAHLLGQCPSKLQRARREKILDLELVSGESLLVGIVDNRLQHWAIGFDPVRKGVVAEDLPRRG
jgi:hypothetical protein